MIVKKVVTFMANVTSDSAHYQCGKPHYHSPHESLQGSDGHQLLFTVITVLKLQAVNTIKVYSPGLLKYSRY